ncbi:MAG: hypothetical protein GWP10_07440 [Nitrospiraceae bacterium]|nr:hypothetical protein [Nitrospiraceae bacterium]
MPVIEKYIYFTGGANRSWPDLAERVGTWIPMQRITLTHIIKIGPKNGKSDILSRMFFKKRITRLWYFLSLKEGFETLLKDYP